MKKRIVNILLVFVLVFVSILTGCRAKEKEQTNAEPKQEVTQEPEKAKFVITSDGQSEYVIVQSQKASETEKKAANELQIYIEKISGVKLPIVTDDTGVTDKEIIIGKTNREEEATFNREELGEDGFVIRTTQSKLWLTGGGDRGTLYSVYSFLEDYLGCRFYTEEIEKIPEMKDILVTENEEDKQIPVFFFRDAAWKDYFGTDISVKRKINAPIWGRELPDDVGGGITYAMGVGGHSFSSFVNPNEYFETHPEYFSMNEEGKRVADKQICLTNPDVLELTIKGVRQWLKEDPKATIITVSQNDTQGACLCDNCKKVYEEEGGAFSGAILRFVNAVAEDIAKDYPNVWIDTMAYSYTRSAPTKTKPADNVMVRLATMGTCFNHIKEGANCKVEATPTYLDGSNNTFSEDIEAWGAICDTLFVYDYTCNYQFWPMTFPDFDNLRENIKYYAQNNAIGIEMQGNQQSSSVEFSELRAYLISKLLWNPYMSEEEYYVHMDDFLEGVYGAGGKYIRQYIEAAQKLTEEKCFDLITGPYEMYPVAVVDNHKAGELPEDLTVEMVKNYEETDWTKYWNWYVEVEEPEITAKGTELFGKALGLAETEVQKKEIERTYLQVEYIKSYYYNKRITEADLYQLIREFMEANPSEFTEVEKKELPAKITNMGEQQMYKIYAAYNETLCERLVEEGVTYIYEQGSLNGWQGFDFSVLPVLWISS